MKRAFHALTCLCTTFLGAAGGEGSAESVSPFGTPSAERPSPKETPAPFELTGVVNSSQRTLVGIMKPDAGRSFWIHVGESQGGIEVISHDPRTDRVTVRADGVQYVIGLRANTLGAAVPSFTNLGTIPLFGVMSPPAQIQAQEKEARHLVGDLLELGLAQRKASQQNKPRAPAALRGGSEGK
jgi:hypothetical protein